MVKEFEDERGQLGDLPDGLARERGEDFQLNQPPTTLPPDMLNSRDARDSAARAGIGGPILDYNVRGVYDSRPVNGEDFNQFVQLTVSNVTGEPVRFACLQVPAGRVAVLRQMYFFDLEVQGGGIAPDNLRPIDVTVQLTRNGGVIMPQDMEVRAATVASMAYNDRLGVKGGNTINAFSIYDENEIIGLNVELFGVGAAVTRLMYVNFYGNLLLKTGVPAPFEVANKGGGKPTTVMATQRDLRSAASPAMRTGAVTVTGQRVGVPPRGRR